MVAPHNVIALLMDLLVLAALPEPVEALLPVETRVQAEALPVNRRLARSSAPPLTTCAAR